jgi:Fe-S-cluster containining protein
MKWDDSFNFHCHPGLDCFTTCCRDVTIFLNPMDVGAMRKALGITSTDFLERYTVRIVHEKTGVPAVVLKMREDDNKKCPFVTDEGCTVYESRPYSCRLYPLDTDQGVEYRFVVTPDKCHGIGAPRQWTVETWRGGQGLLQYDEPDFHVKDVMAPEQFWEAPVRDPRMQDMILMSLYDPDRFREFIFNSSFLSKLRVDEDIIEKIRNDDVALLYFGAQWLRFVLFGKRGVFKFDREYLEQKKKEVFQRRRDAR